MVVKYWKAKLAAASTLNQVASWYAEYKACTGKSQGEQETPTALQLNTSCFKPLEALQLFWFYLDGVSSWKYNSWDWI